MPALRIAVLSDQHIHTGAAPESWERAQTAFAATIRANVDHVVLAGDTFDSAGAMLRDHERVERHLRKLGLWHRDRLTIVPGNHDRFHTPHYGTMASKAREFAANALHFDASGWVRDSEAESIFDAWLRPLTRAADRLDAQHSYPMRKLLGHVALYAADTAPWRTLDAANGFWWPEVDTLLRDATPEAEERRILAVHHPPLPSRQTTLKDIAKAFPAMGRAKFPLAYPREHFDRLREFVDDAAIDAVVCGHIHTRPTGYAWKVGRSKVPAYLVGRTGGLCRGAPMFGVLTVPSRGAVKWREVVLPQRESDGG